MIRIHSLAISHAHWVSLRARGGSPACLPPADGKQCACPREFHIQRPSRNRWDRADMVAAIGQQSPEAEVIVRVWPPRVV